MKSNSEPLNLPPIFFIDHSLGSNVVAKALSEAGEDVRVLKDHFPENINDVDLLEEVGRRGWVFLSKDRKIRYRTAEQAALIKAQVAAFFLTSGQLRAEEMAQAFIKALPRMKRLLLKNPRPFIAKVTRSGLVTKIFPHD